MEAASTSGELSDVVPAAVAQALVQNNPEARCIEVVGASQSIHADNLRDFMAAVDALLAGL